MKAYSRIQKMLTASGHSGAKALEIVLDAKRGDDYAIFHIRIVRGLRRWYGAK